MSAIREPGPLTRQEAKRFVGMADRSRIPHLESLTPFEREVAFHAVIVALAGLNEPTEKED